MNVAAERQIRRFATDEQDEDTVVLATASAIFAVGQMDVQLWIRNGVLFCMDYRSAQKIYYPPGDYLIETMTLWPKGETERQRVEAGDPMAILRAPWPSCGHHGHLAGIRRS
jgi:hypothetical protein